MRIKDVPGIILNLICYGISGVLKYFPRKKSRWAFGASGGFKDNPKYLFYEVVENHPEIHPVWISQNKQDCKYLTKQGMPAYYWLSLKGLYYSLTAGVYIVDHSTPSINRFLEGGAFYVNLWHGASVKRVRWQSPDYYVKEFHLKDASEMRTSFLFKIRTYVTLFHKIDLCLAPSSSLLKEFFAPMMDIPESNCFVGVYPRSRLMIEGKESAMNFIKKYEPTETMDFVKKIQSFSKTYIYMPTWRNNNQDFIKQAGIDWQQLNEAMKASNSLFILKLHPFTKINFEGLSQYSNIIQYPKKSDVYTVLPFIDCLITDYSSIYTDFLTMNKEIILYVFDYDEYVKGECELPGFDKYYIGKRANNFNQLLEIMKSGDDCHVPKEKYDFLMDYFWDHNRNKIDIAEEIKRRIGIS